MLSAIVDNQPMAWFGATWRQRWANSRESSSRRLHCSAIDIRKSTADVGELAIVALGPDLHAIRGVAQLARDTYALTDPADTTLEHVAGSELAAGTFQVHWLAFVGKARIACDDTQLGELREVRDDVLGDAVGKILLAWLRAQVVECKHGDNRRSGCSNWQSVVCRRALGRRGCFCDLEADEKYLGNDFENQGGRAEGIARSIFGARFGTISVTMHASLIFMGRLLLRSGIPAAGFKIGSVWNGNSVSLLEIGPWSKLHKLLI